MQPLLYLAHFCTCYDCSQLLSTLRVLKYLYAAKDKQLTFKVGTCTVGDGSISGARLTINSNADLATCFVDHKS